jgi:hypothetical protein
VSIPEPAISWVGLDTLNFFLCNEPGKMFKRPVVRFLCFRWKEATGYLPTGKVMLDAIATDSPPFAGIGACAFRLILVNFTFHGIVKGLKVHFIFAVHCTLFLQKTIQQIRAAVDTTLKVVVKYP